MTSFRYLHQHGHTNNSFTEGDEIETAVNERFRVRGVHWNSDILLISPIEGRRTNWDTVLRVSVAQTGPVVIRAAARKTSDSDEIPIKNPELLAKAPGEPHAPDTPADKAHKIITELPKIRRFGSDLDAKIREETAKQAKLKLKVEVKKRSVVAKVKLGREDNIPVRVSLFGKHHFHVAFAKTQDGKAALEIPLPKGKKFDLLAMTDSQISEILKIKGR